jgi:transcriptional regulator with XRE-family HTH domain
VIFALYYLNAIYHQSNIVDVIDLSDIRRAAGVTQVQLAAALNTSQGQISRFERQSDMLLSTLSSYLTALGASARLSITVNGQTVEQDLTTSEGQER